MGLTASALNCAFPRLVAETADGQETVLTVLSHAARAMQNRGTPVVEQDSRRGIVERRRATGVSSVAVSRDSLFMSRLLREKRSALKQFRPCPGRENGSNRHPLKRSLRSLRGSRGRPFSKLLEVENPTHQKIDMPLCSMNSLFSFRLTTRMNRVISTVRRKPHAPTSSLVDKPPC